MVAPLIDEIARKGARRMFAATLAAEVDAYLAEMADPRDNRGRRLMVRNVHACSRQTRPRRPLHRSTIVEENRRTPPVLLDDRAPMTPEVAEVLPLLYLHDRSCPGMPPAPEQALDSGADLSA